MINMHGEFQTAILFPNALYNSNYLNVLNFSTYLYPLTKWGCFKGWSLSPSYLLGCSHDRNK